MDIRISDDREMSFFIYSNQGEILLSPEEWIENNEKGQAFYKSEIENGELHKSTLNIHHKEKGLPIWQAFFFLKSKNKCLLVLLFHRF
ncbi:hypothetical protein [Pseudoalteromonas sp. PPB1]|uniref:hypothetical protein n=1 Tax=Pseudoalteromonas sp. PPB1 TaxID=2756136 RepID=UPI001891B27D|nr:hypothetical protein [Pseudoalteromonas sp. PPB1]